MNMIRFFQSLFDNAGDFIVDTYNTLAEFVDSCPSFVVPIFLGLCALIVVRVCINVL